MPARFLITGLSLLALLGCSGNDRRPAEAIPASFTTRILADGTKLFTFAMEPEGGRRAGPGASAPMRRGERGGPGPAGQPQRRGPSAAASHRQLQALLEQNRYCRDGYVTLQQYALYGGYTIRGECRDGADAGDRSRFAEAPPTGSP